MPKLDISQAADFSRLTQGTLSDLTALFGGRDPREWDILEGSYNGVRFHVFESKVPYDGSLSRINDIGGRRKVKYQFPYRDGQTTDDLGRKPGSFQLEVILHGPRYMEGFRALQAEFNKPTPGKLVHPVRGEITCGVEDVSFMHSADMRKAVGLNVTFIEHNFTIGNIRDLQDSSVKAALAAALAVFKIIDNAINKVEGATLLIRGVKNRIKSFMEVYKRDSAKSLTRMNQTFNAKGSSADIPALLPVNLGGTGTATSADGGLSLTSGGIVSQSNFVVVRSINDPFNGVPVDQLSEETIAAIAVAEIAKEIAAQQAQLAIILRDIDDNGGALELYDTKLELRQTALLIQDVFEKGVASSNARIIEYEVPRLMSLREICFENGIGVERVQEIDLLNPQLLSTNYVPKGTVLRVPVV